MLFLQAKKRREECRVMKIVTVFFLLRDPGRKSAKYEMQLVGRTVYCI